MIIIEKKNFIFVIKMALLIKIATFFRQALNKRNRLFAARQKNDLLNIVTPSQIEKGRSSAYTRLIP